MKDSLANLTARELAAAVKNRLKRERCPAAGRRAVDGGRLAQRRQADTTATAWSMLRRGSQSVV